MSTSSSTNLAVEGEASVAGNAMIVVHNDFDNNNREDNDGASPVSISQLRSTHLDSLPYIDYLHPDYEAYALTLIENEMQAFPPNPQSLDYLGPNILDKEPSFGKRHAAITQAEYEALVARNGTARSEDEYTDFESNSIAASPPPSSYDNPDEWHTSVQRAKVEYEIQRSRLTNLELQSIYDAGQWQLHNTMLDNQASSMAECVNIQRYAVDEINARRQREQEHAEPKLNMLGQKWEELVMNNRNLADATLLLEREVRQLRANAGDDENMKESGDKEEEEEEEVEQ